MTSKSNPEVMQICYAQGWASNPNYMTYEEAANVTDTTAFNNAFNNSNIIYFNEAKFFTGITKTISFTAKNLLEFAFPPNCLIDVYSILGKLPKCYLYDFNTYNDPKLVNGPQKFGNKNIANIIVDENNTQYGVVDGYLGEGKLLIKKPTTSLWIIPNPKNGIFIYPLGFTWYSLASVSLFGYFFNGHTIITKDFSSGNVLFSEGGRNIKKIVVFNMIRSDGYRSFQNVGYNVVDEEKVLIVPADTTCDFTTSVWTQDLLNPDACNFILKKVNFGITIYNEKVLWKFKDICEDEYFMTKEECANITTLGDRFKDSDIETFEELQYFTGITKIEDYTFQNCINLKKIVIPSNVVEIGDNAFYNCPNLNEIIYA